MGAASEEGQSLDSVYSLGKDVVSNLVTMGVSLDHCHVPGSSSFAQLKPDEAEIGMGIHNEPGCRKVSPIPKPDVLIKDILEYLLDQSDSDRAYVKFAPEDDVVFLFNNLGGISQLEQGAIVDEALNQLGMSSRHPLPPPFFRAERCLLFLFRIAEKEYSIRPVRVFASAFLTSLNAPGFSITLFNASKAGKSDDILRFVDAPSDALGWTGGVHKSKPRPRQDQYKKSSSADGETQFDHEFKGLLLFSAFSWRVFFPLLPLTVYL
jgi:dihydroxyacetone kinase